MSDFLNVSKEVRKVIPQVIAALSNLPAEKSTTSVEGRTMALMFALDGEDVTVEELLEATKHFIKTETFFPVPSMFLKRIFSRRADRPKQAVLLKDGRVALVLPEHANERYFEEWGEYPIEGTYFEPRKKELGGERKALPELKVKRMPE